MAGSAGSKYGINIDGIPIRGAREDFQTNEQGKGFHWLRDIRELVRQRMLKNHLLRIARVRGYAILNF